MGYLPAYAPCRELAPRVWDIMTHPLRLGGDLASGELADHMALGWGEARAYGSRNPCPAYVLPAIENRETRAARANLDPLRGPSGPIRPATARTGWPEPFAPPSEKDTGGELPRYRADREVRNLSQFFLSLAGAV